MSAAEENHHSSPFQIFYPAASKQVLMQITQLDLNPSPLLCKSLKKEVVIVLGGSVKFLHFFTTV